MAAIKMTIEQNLETGELSVSIDGRSSFPITLQMVLTALKLSKDKVLQTLKEAPDEELKRLAGDLSRDAALLAAEGELYDLMNLSVSNFLNTEFPLVNEQLSLTELAATEEGLDRSASVEKLLAAENKFIDKKPDLAKDTRELKLKPIHKFDGSVGGPNRAQRRSIKKGGKSK